MLVHSADKYVGITVTGDLGRGANNYSCLKITDTFTLLVFWGCVIKPTKEHYIYKTYKLEITPRCTHE